MMIDGKMEPADAQNMLRGTADPLHSEFHLGYNMLLNLTRIEGGEATHLIHRSFLQFTDTLQTPAIIEELENLEKEYGGDKVFQKLFFFSRTFSNSKKILLQK